MAHIQNQILAIHPNKRQIKWKKKSAATITTKNDEKTH